MEAIMRANNNAQSYNERQMQDARTICTMRQTVPAEKRSMFAAILNAYMDGMAAGEAIAASGTRK